MVRSGGLKRSEGHHARAGLVDGVRGGGGSSRPRIALARFILRKAARWRTRWTLGRRTVVAGSPTRAEVESVGGRGLDQLGQRGVCANRMGAQGSASGWAAVFFLFFWGGGWAIRGCCARSANPVRKGRCPAPLKRRIRLAQRRRRLPGGAGFGRAAQGDAGPWSGSQKRITSAPVRSSCGARGHLQTNARSLPAGNGRSSRRSAQGPVTWRRIG